MILASSQQVQGHTVSLSEPLTQSLKAENQANGALSLKTQPICLAVLIPQSSHRLLGRRPCDPQAVALLVNAHLNFDSALGQGGSRLTSKTLHLTHLVS